MAKDLEKTKLIVEFIGDNPDIDTVKVTTAILKSGLLQRLSSAEDEFNELPMLNHIAVMGRLTRDPELRHVGEAPVCNFSIACDRDYKNANGEKETDFIDVVAWRKTAETVSQYFTKGRMAVVEGRLQLRDWTDKEGNKRRSAEIVADRVYFGDFKPKEGNTSHGSGAGDPGTPPDNFVPDFGDGDGELPL